MFRTVRRLLVILAALTTLAGCEYLVGIEDRSLGGSGGADVEACPNLLAGGDFEGWTSPANVPPYWSEDRGALVRTTDAHGGQYALEIQGIAEKPSWRLFSTTIDLEVGGYQFEAWLKHEAGHQSPPHVSIERDPYPREELVWGGSSVWEEVSATLDFTGTDDDGMIMLNAAYVADEQTILLDDVRLVRTECLEP